MATEPRSLEETEHEEPRALMLAEREQAGLAALDDVLGTGDLARLSNVQRVGHYLRLCVSLGLNPLSRPFDWIYFKEQGSDAERLVLYPNQSCTAQLRRQHHMRVELVRKEVVGELFVCEVKATTPDGREDFASKYVALTNRYGRLTGQQLGNAMMKAETGAKRRVTLSMIGLSEPPIEDGAARRVVIDGTGRIIERPTEEERYLADHPAAARVIGEPTYETTAETDEAVDAVAVSQAARPEELQQPRRSGPRPSFRPTEEQVAAWQRAWFAAVKGSSLDDDDSRHRYVEQWTASEGWPRGKQTTSLPIALGRMTEREADDFLQHVRALVDDEQRANAEALADDARRDDADGEHPF
jgi:hypothetical protein